MVQPGPEEQPGHSERVQNRPQTALECGFKNSIMPGPEFPQGPKPRCFVNRGGTAEAVPFQSPFLKYALRKL